MHLRQFSKRERESPCADRRLEFNWCCLRAFPQYQKYEQGPDGVKALQETAKKYSDKMNAAASEGDKPSKHLHCENPTH